MLDRDLAAFYDVQTKRLKEEIKRNIGKFPEHFMFVLTKKEFQNLRPQFSTSRWGDCVVKELANYLKQKHPDLKGFNSRRLHRMC